MNCVMLPKCHDGMPPAIQDVHEMHMYDAARGTSTVCSVKDTYPVDIKIFDNAVLRVHKILTPPIRSHYSIW